jgi:hypothetical protein
LEEKAKEEEEKSKLSEQGKIDETKVEERYSPELNFINIPCDVPRLHIA